MRQKNCDGLFGQIGFVEDKKIMGAGGQALIQELPPFPRSGRCKIMPQQLKPVVSPKHFLPFIDHTERSAKNSQAIGTVGIFPQLGFNCVVLGSFHQLCSIQAGIIQQSNGDLLVSEVKVLRPGAMEKRMDGFSLFSVLRRRQGRPESEDGVEQELGAWLEWDAVNLSGLQGPPPCNAPGSGG